MNPNFFTLFETASVNTAIESLRNKPSVEAIYYLYVVDEHKHLVGIVSLRQLIMSSGQALLKDIMANDVVTVHSNQDQVEVAKIIKKHNFLAVPVVDDDKKLLGVITVDEVINLIQKEAAQELYQMSGVERDERVFTPVLRSIRNRAPWLVINLGTAILASYVVGLFEGTIQKAVLLATFLPIVAGMGGNAGAQTLAIVIRGIAVGDFAFSAMKKVLTKEIFVGIANGVITGLIMAVVAWYWKGLPILGLIIMLAMIGNLFVSGATGVVIPLGLKALKIDPAVASTVICTTFTDCCGFFFFLGLAAVLIKYLL